MTAIVIYLIIILVMIVSQKLQCILFFNRGVVRVLWDLTPP